MRSDKVVSEVLGEEVTLSPSDLYNREFRRAVFGGYRMAEVDHFLERVADVLESMIAEVRTLRQQNTDLRKRVDEYREMDDSLRNALVSSRKLADDILDSARREAETITGEARLSAAQVQLEAERIPQRLSNDIDLMRRSRQRFRSEFLAILETHRRLLDSLVPEEPPLLAGGFLDVGDAARLPEPMPEPPSERASEAPGEEPVRDDGVAAAETQS